MSLKQIAFATTILVLSAFGETASASADEGLAPVLRQVVETKPGRIQSGRCGWNYEIHTYEIARIQ